MVKHVQDLSNIQMEKPASVIYYVHDLLPPDFL